MNFIVMGVAGSGKSTVAKLLAARLQAEFLEGDDFHPPANVAQMSNGLALTDADRLPWLVNLNRIIGARNELGRPFVLACSALKKSYRQQLAAGGYPLLFFYLKGTSELITQRMQQRKNHFMSTDLVISQFEALQEPEEEECAVTVSIDGSVEQILQQVIRAIADIKTYSQV
ncbi:MAG: hypothetical protein OFPI_23640 [Osedax symbiont Rs2]|nr:MAG: hypothetical protein OFPI_23640 [Osedax symbiont Rs2]